MTTINRLSSVDEVNNGDQFVLYSANSGDARKASASLVKEYMQKGLDTSGTKVTQYAAPSSTAFSVQITDSDSSVWLILTPTGTFADGEIVLPALTNCVDKQEVLVNCTQIVTTFAVDGNGATVTGEPSTLAANEFFTLRFDAATSVWYRIS